MITFEKFPQLKRVLTSLAWENSMIDREQPIEELLDKWELEVNNQPRTRILAVCRASDLLSNEELDTLTGGEYDDQRLILKKIGEDGDLVDQFLNDMFEVT